MTNTSIEILNDDGHACIHEAHTEQTYTHTYACIHDTDNIYTHIYACMHDAHTEKNTHISMHACTQLWFCFTLKCTHCSIKATVKMSSVMYITVSKIQSTALCNVHISVSNIVNCPV